MTQQLMQPADIKEFLSKLPVATEAIFSLTNIPLSYSEASLVACEEFINSAFPANTQVAPTTIIPFGFYLGEVIVRNITNATWMTDEPVKSVFDISIVINQGENKQVVKPFLRASKFFSDRTDGLTPFYSIINAMALGFLDKRIQKASDNPGEWDEIPGSAMFRVFTSIEDYNKRR